MYAKLRHDGSKSCCGSGHVDRATLLFSMEYLKFYYVYDADMTHENYFEMSWKSHIKHIMQILLLLLLK